MFDSKRYQSQKKTGGFCEFCVYVSKLSDVKEVKKLKIYFSTHFKNYKIVEEEEFLVIHTLATENMLEEKLNDITELFFCLKKNDESIMFIVNDQKFYI